MHAYYVGIEAINCGRSKPCQYKASHSIQLSKLENVTCTEISVYLFDSLLYTYFIRMYIAILVYPLVSSIYIVQLK